VAVDVQEADDALDAELAASALAHPPANLIPVPADQCE
jgi:hypothetical protein